LLCKQKILMPTDMRILGTKQNRLMLKIREPGNIYFLESSPRWA
jgi:hypothetical protein